MGHAFGQKSKAVKGWLSQKLHNVQRQGQKFLKSDSLNTALKIGAVAGTVYGGVKLNEATNERSGRISADKALQALPTKSTEQFSFVDASPSTSSFINNPQALSADSREALGFNRVKTSKIKPEVQAQRYEAAGKSIPALEWDRTKLEKKKESWSPPPFPSGADWMSDF